MQLTAKPKRSKVWLSTILIASALGIVSLSAVDFRPPWMLLPALLLLAVASFRALAFWRRVPDRIEFGTGESSGAMMARIVTAGQSHDCLVRNVGCWPWLIVLSLVPEQGAEASRSARSLVLPRDSLDPDVFRRLLILLRTMKTGDDAPE